MVFFLAVLELTAFCHIYGVQRISDDFYSMLGKKPHKFYLICWKYITPLVMSAVFIGFVFFYEAPVGTNDNQEYSKIAHAFGIVMTIFFLSMLPICMFYEIYKSQMGTLKDVRKLFNLFAN